MDVGYFDEMMEQLEEEWITRYREIFMEDQIVAISEMLTESFNTCMESFSSD